MGKNELNGKHTKKPGLPPSDLTQMLMAANHPALEDLARWLFHPGMTFDSIDKWWGDFGTREFPHEGIDLCLYRDRSGKMHRVGPEIHIPVLHDGIVRAVFRDYLVPDKNDLDKLLGSNFGNGG